MEYNNKRKVKDSDFIRVVYQKKLNHIIFVLSKMTANASLRLNDCGWMFKDEKDHNYKIYKIHEDAEHMIHRCAWFLNHIPDGVQNGDDFTKDLCKFIQELLLFTERMVRESNKSVCIIGKDEMCWFDGWCHSFLLKLKNIIDNPSSKANVTHNEIQRRKEEKKLSRLLWWAVTTIPGDNNYFSFAISYVIGLRYMGKMKNELGKSYLDALAQRRYYQISPETCDKLAKEILDIVYKYEPLCV